MVLYIGDKPVGLMKVVEKKVPKVKFGASIDNLLGNVDTDGNYTAPTEGFVLDLTGVKNVPGKAFQYLFMAYEVTSGADTGLVGIIANDVVSVGAYAFYYIAAYNTALEYVHFDGLEEIIMEYPNLGGAFANAFFYAKEASFKSLKRITYNHTSGAVGTFSGAFQKTFLDFDSVFPALEFVKDGRPFSKMFDSKSSARRKIYASKIHTCISVNPGYSAQNFAIFNELYADIYLPSCTYAEGYLCGKATTYKTVLHFASAHQADIEACEGYDYLFGAKEIYFDLMLNITFNGVVYSREYTIGGYTSWKDADGNIVYTDATAEPAVGTVVYSDQGTTQVGTVSEVA